MLILRIPVSQLWRWLEPHYSGEDNLAACTRVWSKVGQPCEAFRPFTGNMQTQGGSMEVCRTGGMQASKPWIAWGSRRAFIRGSVYVCCPRSRNNRNHLQRIVPRIQSRNIQSIMSDSKYFFLTLNINQFIENMMCNLGERYYLPIMPWQRTVTCNRMQTHNHLLR